MNDARLDRRAFLAGGAALSASLMLPASARAQTLAATVTIDPTRPSYRIPIDFMGLSFEASKVTGSLYFNAQNTVLIGYVRDLGPGVLRIGGNSVDRTIYGLDDLRNLATFSRATGWPVLLGLGLGRANAQQAIGQAEDAAHALGDRLVAFEIGNEPDLYAQNGLRPSSYGYRDFLSEFMTIANGIRQRIPNAHVAGPGTAAHTEDWVVPFAQDARSRVTLLTQHYYRMGPPSDPSVTIDRLLYGDDDERLAHMLTQLNDAASNAHLPYRITECGAVSGAGKSGVSDTYAAALWGFDFCNRVAAANGSGVNFQDGSTSFGAPIGERESGNGNFYRRPLYFGLQFFASMANSRVLPLQLGGSHPNLRAYAARQDNGSILVALVNPDQSRRAAVTISGTGMGSAAARTLTGPAPGAKSVTSISESVRLQGNPIEVAPSSAMLVTLSP
ncbi:MAG: hypothetical protein ACXWNK_08150 [Vulcanimicrobiaceae bacterium]